MSLPQQNLVIGFSTSKGYETQTLILVRSLRKFGGELSNLPVWAMVPESIPFDNSFNDILLGLDVKLYPFEIDESISRFPFATKAIAAAQAEELAEKSDAVLAWHDRTGVFLNSPTAFYLPEGKSLGFRPTDIANIGAPYGKPLPAFWETVCELCDLQIEQMPRITSVIDQKDLYLYVNAGLLVVRPKNPILRDWADHLTRMYNQPIFQSYYKENYAYAIFMHQAALTAAVIKNSSPEERFILPDSYLFSVDNFFDYPDHLRPATLEEISTGRFHDFFALENWEELIVAGDELKSWFKEQLRFGPYWPKSG